MFSRYFLAKILLPLLMLQSCISSIKFKGSHLKQGYSRHQRTNKLQGDEIITNLFGDSTNTTLKIALPSFTYQPWVYIDENGNYKDGMVVRFLKLLTDKCETSSKSIPCWDIQYVPVSIGELALVENMLTELKFDLIMSRAVTDYSINTVPIITVFYQVLIRKIAQPSSIWQIFEPFTWELWVLIIATSLIATLAIFLMNIIETDGDFSDYKDYIVQLYHTWACILGQDEYDLYSMSYLGRFYRFGLLFFTLIITATYTANLAAFLTRPSTALDGPTTMEELSDSVICSIEMVDTPSYYALNSYSRDQVVPPPEIWDSAEADEEVWKWALDSLNSKKCDAIVDATPTLKYKLFEGDNCDRYIIPPLISFAPFQIFFDTRMTEQSLVRAFNAAVLYAQALPEYMKILRDTLGEGKSCKEQSISSTTPLGIHQMLGLFIITFMIIILSIIGTYIKRKARGKPVKMEDDRHEERVKIDTILKILQNIEHGHHQDDRTDPTLLNHHKETFPSSEVRVHPCGSLP